MRLQRRLSPQINVDLTPLIDVVFQLVIFFMVTSVFKIAPGISLELPESGTAEPLTVKELVISAESEDSIYVNNTLTTLKGLPAVLKTWIEENPGKDRQVILEANKDATYQFMMKLLDILRQNGLADVGLRTKAQR